MGNGGWAGGINYPDVVKGVRKGVFFLILGFASPSLLVLIFGWV